MASKDFIDSADDQCLTVSPLTEEVKEYGPLSRYLWTVCPSKEKYCEGHSIDGSHAAKPVSSTEKYKEGAPTAHMAPGNTKRATHGIYLGLRVKGGKKGVNMGGMSKGKEKEVKSWRRESKGADMCEVLRKKWTLREDSL